MTKTIKENIKARLSKLAENTELWTKYLEAAHFEKKALENLLTDTFKNMWFERFPKSRYKLDISAELAKLQAPVLTLMSADDVGSRETVIDFVADFCEKVYPLVLSPNFYLEDKMDEPDIGYTD